jgi:hypothetical protein
VTGQDAFDAVWRHFVVENGKPSHGQYLGASGCMYRGPGGARCAAGVLLDDRDYGPALEGHPASYMGAHQFPNSPLLRAALLTFPTAPGVQRSLASHLQRAHDYSVGATVRSTFSEFRTNIEAALRRVADRFGLEVPA